MSALHDSPNGNKLPCTQSQAYPIAFRSADHMKGEPIKAATEQQHAAGYPFSRPCVSFEKTRPHSSLQSGNVALFAHRLTGGIKSKKSASCQTTVPDYSHPLGESKLLCFMKPKVALLSGRMVRRPAQREAFLSIKFGRSISRWRSHE